MYILNEEEFKALRDKTNSIDGKILEAITIILSDLSEERNEHRKLSNFIGFSVDLGYCLQDGDYSTVIPTWQQICATIKEYNS